jgi:hypothetical protein
MAQPTTRLETTSRTTANYSQPDQVEMEVLSAVQTWSGRWAVKSRPTRSGAGAAWGRAGSVPAGGGGAADQAGGAHQPGHPRAAHLDAVVQPELGVDPWGAVGAAAVLADGPDLGGQGLVGHGAGRGRPALPGRAPRPRHTQPSAQPGDAMGCFSASISR